MRTRLYEYRKYLNLLDVKIQTILQGIEKWIAEVYIDCLKPIPSARNPIEFDCSLSINSEVICVTLANIVANSPHGDKLLQAILDALVTSRRNHEQGSFDFQCCDKCIAIDDSATDETAEATCNACNKMEPEQYTATITQTWLGDSWRIVGRDLALSEHNTDKADQLTADQ